MILIRGDFGEGGGSIVRLSVALAATLKKPVKITKIRLGRKNPGLREQHLKGVRAVAELCNGTLNGDKLGSTEVEFYPGDSIKKKVKVKVETAGSIGLVLQSLMIPCFFAKHDVEIDIQGGGTIGLHAPNLLYTINVLLPILAKMGLNAKIEIKKFGFYPKGGGNVKAVIKASNIKNLDLSERGKLKEINGVSVASDFLKKANVAERTTNEAKKLLVNLNCPIKIKNGYVDSLCPGSGLILYAVFDNCIIGGDAIGERGKRAELVGNEAANNLIKEINSKATVDEYLSDQLIPYMALAKGKSVIKVRELTKHTETNMWLVKQFIDVDFEIKDNEIVCLKKL